MNSLDDDFFERAKACREKCVPSSMLDRQVLTYAHARVRRAWRWTQLTKYSACIAGVAIAVLGLVWSITPAALAPQTSREYAELWNFDEIQQETAEVSLDAEYSASYMLAWSNYRGDAR